ncbi:MAG: energy-coupling factor transporter ATPase [Defluviitaleaceae bacterium]|nr:energy-coupling factor transporter ATPase [Defluviitaleaceae bacterium]MCL2263384.1 energy-coupling factor transporter ATPase [Defluviitaleaceae bacterium]
MINSENLTFKYEAYDASEQTRAALRDVNVKINAGEFVAVLGHNGSGKSTLARHLNALLAPTEGTLWVGGRDTKDPENTWEIRQSVGMVFQNPDNQIIATIVEEDVAFGPENLGVCPTEIRERVDETLAIVRMSKYAAAPPHHLSGGQKQRVAIAGVLAMRPSCIVLDEPSAMLDPSGRREVMETITRLNREQGITIILITHFMEEAARTNRIIVMDEGKVVMDDEPQKIFANVEKMTELKLGVPNVTELAFELKKRGVPMPQDIITIDNFIAAYTSAVGSRSLEAVNGSRSAQASPICEAGSQGEQASPAAAQKSAPILELKNVSHVYNANSVFEKAALSDISLQIFKGEMLTIIGHTGSGKSTLIQHFNALLKPTAGEIFFDGENIHASKKSLKEIRQRVGLVFQYPEHQLFEATIYKDVAFGPTRMGLSEEDIHRQTIEALEAVGLSEKHYEKSPFELSGGQKRRAAIAGVLAMRPEILILDEPAAGLDPRGRENIFAQIKKMHKALGITVVLVSHSMDDAARLTDRVIVMNESRIVCDGTPSEIFARQGQSEFLKKIGLDVPQILRLMTRLNEKDPRFPAQIFSIEAAADALAGAVQP